VLARDSEGTLPVVLGRTNRPPARKIYAPYFPKPKTEGWWLVLADGDELLALKRMSVGRDTKAELQVLAPEEPGSYEFTLYLVSDSYIGFDQQVPVRVVVT